MPDVTPDHWYVNVHKRAHASTDLRAGGGREGASQGTSDHGLHVDLHLDDRAGYVDRRVADRDRRVSVGRGLDDQARGRAEVVDPVDQDAWWLFCRKSTSCPSGSAHSMS
jgi:hypothetical protein